MHSSSFNEVWWLLKEGDWITGRRWRTVKVEIWVRFNIGEIVEVFVVLDKVDFEAPIAEVVLILEPTAFPSMISERGKELS